MSLETLKNLLDAEVLLHQFGPWALIGIALIVFIESGVLFPFLPGDSLLVTAEAFFNRRGPLALVIGRFVPIVRTYVPVAAGTAQMPYRNFVFWNVGGALAWVGSMVLIGALLGHIPGITHSIDGIILLILGISMLPVAISATTSYIKKRRTK